MSCLAESKRVTGRQVPATVVAATIRETPLRAWRAFTSGARCHCDNQLINKPGKSLHPLKLLMDRIHIFLKGDLLGTMRHLDVGDPVPVSLAPIRQSSVAITVEEKKSQQHLAAKRRALTVSSLPRSYLEANRSQSELPIPRISSNTHSRQTIWIIDISA